MSVGVCMYVCVDCKVGETRVYRQTAREYTELDGVLPTHICTGFVHSHTEVHILQQVVFEVV